MTENRVASVPYLLNSPIGSGEFPRDLLNFLPCSSLKMLVKYTSLNGASHINSKPDIIILATQKNIISGPVTKALVG